MYASQVQNPRRSKRRFILLVAAVILVLQFILVSLTFPVSELLSNNPVFHIDAAWHWYHIKVAEDVLQTGKIVGYDPMFNAGYPGGVTYNWSGKVPAALAILLKSRLSEIVTYKLYVFVSAVIAAVCVPVALFLLRLGRGEILIGSLFGMILWWASMFRWYHTAGMVSFVAASYASLPYFAKVLQYLSDEEKSGPLLSIGIVGALATFWHPLFAIPIILGTLSYIGLNSRQIDWSRALKLVTIIPLVVLLLNLFWLYPIFHYQRAFAAGIVDIAPYGKLVSVSNLWMELAGIWRGTAHGSKLYVPIALAVAWQWLAPRTSFHEQRARVFAVTAILLNVMAHLGGGLPLVRSLQPNRFAPVGYLFACVPASLGVCAMWQTARTGAVRWMRWTACATLTAVALITTYAIYEVRQEVSWRDVGHYGAMPPEVREVGDLSRWVVNWLKTETTPDARILFETSKGRIHDGAHMAGYYAYTAGREFIGGPYPFTNFAGFWDATAFGKPIAQIPQRTFSDYLDLYNIGWILVYSPEAKRYLDQMPGVVPVAARNELKAYRCERPLTYFLKGSGKVASHKANQLVLSRLDGSEVIIKYHYIRGLKSDPPATISPVQMMDDPNPFVRIINPPEMIRLFL